MNDKLYLNVKIGKDIIDLIYSSCLKEFSRLNPDFLYGGMGGLYYLMTKKDISKNNINNLIESFIRSCKIDKCGLRSRNIMLQDQLFSEFDIGLAHGLTGFIIILCNAYLKGYNFVKPYIHKGIEYILSSAKFKEKVWFPGSILDNNIDNNKLYNVRLGWCYGDLSIASMFMSVARCFHSIEYYNLGINIALNTAKRNTSQSAGITNIYYCHGASSLVSTYYRFYLRSRKMEFLVASNFWKDYLLNSFNANSFLENNLNKTSSILNGASGCIMSLFYTDCQQINEDFFDCLLINF